MHFNNLYAQDAGPKTKMQLRKPDYVSLTVTHAKIILKIKLNAQEKKK